VEKMNFIYAADINEAVETAFKMKGNDAKATIIPDGVAVIVRR
jgi:nickel-dependent lactate racemase